MWRIPGVSDRDNVHAFLRWAFGYYEGTVRERALLAMRTLGDGLEFAVPAEMRDHCQSGVTGNPGCGCIPWYSWQKEEWIGRPWADAGAAEEALDLHYELLWYNRAAAPKVELRLDAHSVPHMGQSDLKRQVPSLTGRFLTTRARLRDRLLKDIRLKDRQIAWTGSRRALTHILKRDFPADTSVGAFREHLALAMRGTTPAIDEALARLRDGAH